VANAEEFKMKTVVIKKTVLILMVLCFLGGCAQKGEQKDAVKTKSQGFKGLPVELRVSSDEGMPVRIQTREGRPLKVQLPEDKPLKVEIKSETALPVALDIKEGEVMPVEIKLPQVDLIYIAIAAGAILLITIFTCLTAISAARSARAACKSADAIKKILQQSKSDLPR
jgi:hypothetical protein